MNHLEVPSDDEVVETLSHMDGGHATALQLCQALVAAGHSIQQSQLAIQRAAERRRLCVHHDWTLSVTRQMVAA
jgi:hypothetical protein